MAIAIAALIDVRFAPDLQAHRYAPFLFAIIFAAFIGGNGPSLIATLISLVTMNYIDYRHEGFLRVDSEDIVQAALFAVTAVCISFLTTRRKAAERELEKANAELRQLDRAKDRFIAAVTHELKTPLTAILGWSAILRQDDDPQLRETATAAIEQSARAQSRLIEDLLDMSRLLLGKLRLDLAPVSVVSTVQQVIGMIAPEAERRAIEVAMTLPADPCVVSGDAVRLQQVFWNLLMNSMKFTPAGGTITLTVKEWDALAEVCVRDTGDGIAPEMLPHVFEPLRQADESVAKGGLGLGLAIVKQLVAMHGGSIEAHSAGAGRGAEFIVRLPLLRNNAA